MSITAGGESEYLRHSQIGNPADRPLLTRSACRLQVTVIGGFCNIRDVSGPERQSWSNA